MRHALLSASLLLGTALVPVQAKDDSTLHPPANRMGTVIEQQKLDGAGSQTESKTIRPSELTGDEDAASAKGETTLHPPTNRMGAAVVQEKPKGVDEQTESKTIRPSELTDEERSAE
jgi:hypothetical protein